MERAGPAPRDTVLPFAQAQILCPIKQASGGAMAPEKQEWKCHCCFWQLEIILGLRRLSQHYGAKWKILKSGLSVTDNMLKPFLHSSTV